MDDDGGMNELAAQIQSYTHAMLMDSPQGMDLKEFYKGQTEPMERTVEAIERLGEIMEAVGDELTLITEYQKAILTEMQRGHKALQSEIGTVKDNIEELIKVERAPRKGRRQKDGTLISEVAE